MPLDRVCFNFMCLKMGMISKGSNKVTHSKELGLIIQRGCRLPKNIVSIYIFFRVGSLKTLAGPSLGTHRG
jgi:hypothetical protein